MFSSNIPTSEAPRLFCLGRQTISYLSLSSAALAWSEKSVGDRALSTPRAEAFEKPQERVHIGADRSFFYGSGTTPSLRRQLEVGRQIAAERDLPGIERCFFDALQVGAHSVERKGLRDLVAELAKPFNHGTPLIVESADRLLRDRLHFESLLPVIVDSDCRVYDRSGPVDIASLRDAAANAVAAYRSRVSETAN